MRDPARATNALILGNSFQVASALDSCDGFLIAIEDDTWVSLYVPPPHGNNERRKIVNLFIKINGILTGLDDQTDGERDYPLPTFDAVS